VVARARAAAERIGGAQAKLARRRATREERRERIATRCAGRRAPNRAGCRI
jgi:hypothetical protein